MTTAEAVYAVTGEEAQALIDRLDANPTKVALMEALDVLDASVNTMTNQNVGVRWILGNYDAFCRIVQWNVAGFVEDNISNMQLLRLMTEPGFLALMPIPSDRLRVVREYYLRHGGWNNYWAKSMLEAGLTKAEIASIVIERLRVCADADPESKMFRETEEFCSRNSIGKRTPIGDDDADPGQWRLEHHGLLWSVFDDDDQFAEAIRVCGKVAPATVLRRWFTIRIRLHNNQPLLVALRKELLGNIREVPASILDLLLHFTPDDRALVIRQLTPMKPYTNMAERRWWMVSEPTLELILRTMYEIGWSDKARSLFDGAAALFAAVDPVLLYRTFNRVALNNRDTTSGMLFNAWLKPEIDTWVANAGYVVGTVETERVRGEHKPVVRMGPVRYVPARAAQPGAHVLREGAEVAFKPHEGRKLNERGSVVAVLMIPTDPN